MKEQKRIIFFIILFVVFKVFSFGQERGNSMGIIGIDPKFNGFFNFDLFSTMDENQYDSEIFNQSSPAGDSKMSSDPESDFTFVRSTDGNSVTITGYAATKQVVNIPPEIRGLPVTLIGDNAFHRKNLTRVTIPESIIIIGKFAFGGNGLTSIIIPSSVTQVGDYAFNGNQLTSVTIPTSVTIIGEGAFSNNKLNNVTIPDSINRIGKSAFADNQLTSVTIPNNLRQLDHGIFENNRLTSVIIPNNITSIGNSVFRNNQLTSVIISTSVTSIGLFAFYQNKLTSIIIPQSVTSIEGQAFSGPGLGGPYNQLTSITIGSNVNIGNQVFPGDFIRVYQSSNRRAATYVNRNGSWSEDW